MTYFRYDGNKRGFDMSGIRWEIRNISQMDDISKGCYEIKQGTGDTYATIVHYQGRPGAWATLDQFDTARFIEQIMKPYEEKYLSTPHVPKSALKTIEQFLGVNSIPPLDDAKPLWYMDNGFLKHRNAPKDARFDHYVLQDRPSRIDIISRVLQEQPMLSDAQIHMVHCNSEDVCIKILQSILSKGDTQ